MRKKQIIILSIVFGISLFGLVLIQIGYSKIAYDIQEERFSYLVNRALDEVVLNLQEKGKAVNRIYQHQKRLILDPPENFNYTFERLSEESFYKNNLTNGYISYEMFKAKHDDKELSNNLWDYIDFEKLKDTIAGFLHKNGVNSNFEIGIKYPCGKFIYFTKNFISRNPDIGFSRPVYPIEGEKAEVIYLKFSNIYSDVKNPVFIIICNILITLTLIICSIYCLTIIFQQKKLSQIKNDFINNMTHEFKTPLASISLASEMLKDSDVNTPPELIKRVATVISDESVRLTAQIEQVLQTAMFSDNRVKYKLEKIHVHKIINELMPQIELRLETKNGKLVSHLEAIDDEVMADHVHIKNVISNFVDNAIKYCNKSPEITICTFNKDKELVISVIDNGIGIAKKDLKFIFERFYRVSTGNVHDIKGFGLGLSYVKKIIETHGGRVDVESTYGKGSCFSVYLPLIIKK